MKKREPAVKPHRKFRITREYLRNIGACKASLEAHAFPIAISTDPEENIKIALEVAQSDRRHDPTWLKATLALEGLGASMCSTWNGEPDDTPLSIMQYLAQIADYELSKVGK